MSYIPKTKIKKIMKKLLMIVAIAVSMANCNDGDSTKVETTVADTTTAPNDSIVIDTVAQPDSSSVTMPPQEGTMAMTEGKMMIMKDGKWEKMNKTMTCTDGCKVTTSGDVIMKDGMKMKLKEGEMINKDGHMMDKNGKMMDMKMEHEEKT